MTYAPSSANVIGRLTSLLATSLLCSFAFIGLFVPMTSALPSVNDSFGYDYTTHVSHGTGWYEGYKDVMNSHSEYEVVSVEGTAVTIQSTGSWTYGDNEGAHESGSNDLVFSFDSASREYIGPTDVEDEGYVDPILWFWVNPADLTVGNTVEILDDTFAVTRTDKTVWVGGLPREVAMLVAVGAYTRDDEYGVFDARYEDTYYFDRATGYVVGEKYVEQDSNYQATFTFTAEVKITSSSYGIQVVWPTVALVYGGIPALLACIGLVAWVVRRGPSTVRIDTASGRATVRLARVRKPTDIEYLVPGGSQYFAPFLSVFVNRALQHHDPVVIGRSGQGLVGTAILDRESGLGSIFALDEGVALALRKRLHMRDFFVEADGGGWNMSPAEKIGEFDILELREPKPQRYDSVRIKAMRREHLEEVIELAEQVYKGKAYSWIRSCFNGGDIGFVAMDSIRMVGFGFATVAGANARLHTLTIAPECRSSGLGTDIMAARLTTLSALGITRVIVEISEHNIASMTIAMRAGFVKIGKTAYYSRNPKGPPEELFQRRM